MSRKIVIEINFNNYGMNPNRLTREWIAERIGIFSKYTLRSLKAQTNPNYLAVVKLAGGCSDIVDSELGKYAPLPANIRFGTSIESKRRVEDYIREAKELFIARIDSDDLYHKTFVQQLHDCTPKPGTAALINQSGYLWDTLSKEMTPVFHTSPPFYVLLYPAADYLAGQRRVIPGKGTHGQVIELPHEILDVPNYVIVLHSSNTSFRRKLPKDRLTQEEMEHVLADFRGGDSNV